MSPPKRPGSFDLAIKIYEEGAMSSRLARRRLFGVGMLGWKIGSGIASSKPNMIERKLGKRISFLEPTQDVV